MRLARVDRVITLQGKTTSLPVNLENSTEKPATGHAVGIKLQSSSSPLTPNAYSKNNKAKGKTRFLMATPIQENKSVNKLLNEIWVIVVPITIMERAVLSCEMYLTDR